MIQFKTVIQKFAKQGEKTGWTYIPVSAKQAAAINPGVRTSYRVSGYLDEFPIEKVAILPMGDGSFIMPLNAGIRKGIQKSRGAALQVRLALDKEPVPADAEFMECLQDEPAALQAFHNLTKGHQNYFSKWIQSAKTEPTKAKRIAMAVNALAKGWGFPEMIRARKMEKQVTGG